MFKTSSIYSNHSDSNKEIITKLIPSLKTIGLNPIREDGKLKIILGGDGTFLKVTRKYLHQDSVFVGINTGNLGFFSEFTREDIPELLEIIQNEQYMIENIPVYDVIVKTKSGEQRLFFVNDLAIERKGTNVIHGKIHFGDSFLTNFVGDGLLISSSIGSTSYNLSAGGSVAYDIDNALQINPINPINNSAYQSIACSFLFKPTSNFIWREGDSKKRPYRLVVDGKEYHFKGIESIEVLNVENYIRILRSHKYSKHKSFSNKILGLNN